MVLPGEILGRRGNICRSLTRSQHSAGERLVTLRHVDLKGKLVTSLPSCCLPVAPPILAEGEEGEEEVH